MEISDYDLDKLIQRKVQEELAKFETKPKRTSYNTELNKLMEPVFEKSGIKHKYPLKTAIHTLIKAKLGITNIQNIFTKEEFEIAIDVANEIFNLIGFEERIRPEDENNISA